MTTEFRERKQEERAKRIARRIFDAKRSGQPMVFPAMDSVVAPGQAWVVPEPSKTALDHMAALGFVDEKDTPEFRDAPRPTASRPEPFISAVSTVQAMPEPAGLAAMIAAGVSSALAAMGFKAQPVPVATLGAAPVNEDR